MKTATVGMRVAHSAQFLRQVGAGYDIASLRGHVIEVKGEFAKSTLVRIRWEDGQESSALTCNLSRAEKGHAVQDVL